MKTRSVAFFADVNLFVVILRNGEFCPGDPIVMEVLSQPTLSSAHIFCEVSSDMRGPSVFTHLS
jgi:hypothetical protein